MDNEVNKMKTNLKSKNKKHTKKMFPVSEENYFGRDQKGNLWYGDYMLIEPSHANPPIDDLHFWCIVCNDIKPVNIDGGVISGIKLGGWMCAVHLIKAKNLLVDLEKFLQH